MLSTMLSKWYTTSYCVIRPLGSKGSSHFRKIISSNGVKVKDSGAIPPGTARKERKQTEYGQIHLTKHRVSVTAEMKFEMQQVEAKTTPLQTRGDETEVIRTVLCSRSPQSHLIHECSGRGHNRGFIFFTITCCGRK